MDFINITPNQFILLIHCILSIIPDNLAPRVTLKDKLLNVLSLNTASFQQLKMQAISLLEDKPSATSVTGAEFKPVYEIRPFSETLDGNVKKKLYNFADDLSKTVDGVLNQIGGMPISIQQKQHLAGILFHVLSVHFTKNPYAHLLTKKSSAPVVSPVTKPDIGTAQQATSAGNTNKEDIQMVSIDGDNDAQGSPTLPRRKKSGTKKRVVDLPPEPPSDTGSSNSSRSSRSSSIDKQSERQSVKDNKPSESHANPDNNDVAKTETVSAKLPKVKEPIAAPPPVVDEDAGLSDLQKDVNNLRLVADNIKKLKQTYESKFKAVKNGIFQLKQIKYNIIELFNSKSDVDLVNVQPVQEPEINTIKTLDIDLRVSEELLRNCYLPENKEKINKIIKEYDYNTADQLLKNKYADERKAFNHEREEITKVVNEFKRSEFMPEASIVGKKIESLKSANRTYEEKIVQLTSEINVLERQIEADQAKIEPTNKIIEGNQKDLKSFEDSLKSEVETLNLLKESTVTYLVNQFNNRFYYPFKNSTLGDFRSVKSENEFVTNVSKRFWDGLPLVRTFLNWCTGETPETREQAARYALTLFKKIDNKNNYDADGSDNIWPLNNYNYFSRVLLFNAQKASLEKSINEIKQAIESQQQSISTFNTTIEDNRELIAAKNDDIKALNAKKAVNENRMTGLDTILQEMITINNKVEAIPPLADNDYYEVAESNPRYKAVSETLQLSKDKLTLHQPRRYYSPQAIS